MDFIIVGIVFISIAWLIERVVSRRALYRERIRLIDKNGDLKDLQEKNKVNVFTNSNTLKYGLVAIGMSIGALVGSFLAQNNVLENDGVGYVFTISLFVGIALIISHYLLKKESQEK